MSCRLTLAAGFALAAAFSAPIALAQDGELEVLHSFAGPDGQVFGTTSGGGAYGWGTVFRINAKGRFKVLHDFSIDSAGFTGFNPRGLTLGSDGYLYGVTLASGPSPGCPLQFGCGGLYRISTSGSTFHGRLLRQTEGGGPNGAPQPASDGFFYGVSSGGGNLKKCDAQGCGTIWRATLDGDVQVIYRFAGGDGQIPWGRVLLGSDGSLYGTTIAGGSAADCQGCGTIFRLAPDGTLATLHDFNGVDGRYVEAGLVEATDGSLYGTATLGGAFGEGTIFRLPNALVGIRH
jgi:uncharacterized repeat protein (TIGR03803 family)